MGVRTTMRTPEQVSQLISDVYGMISNANKVDIRYAYDSGLIYVSILNQSLYGYQPRFFVDINVDREELIKRTEGHIQMVILENL